MAWPGGWGKRGEQSAAPGCRGPERADPALGPPHLTSVPGVRDHRSPQPPLPASDYVCRELLCRAPPLRRRNPAIGTARLQPQSAAVQLLLRSRVALGASTHHSC
ncbi:hypothetical protein NDU88_001405 [Pleurodeles waltl]|uniref:Uncharacterized protein n=1 Tax=Pleurodeles waltl TaxID=8319 RepID=A0AAV7LD23_PLEWA|nr:hypothetical protein NDU88_001405 [Pleurodeles waltl]